MGSDQPFLWVDNNCTSSYKNRLYCSWGSEKSENQLPDNIYMSYSIDQGSQWHSPIQISQGTTFLSGSVIKTDAQGNVYATWRISTSDEPFYWDKLGYSKSTDGGNIWNNNSSQFPYLIGGRSYLFDGGGQSAMAINQQAGEIYIMWSSQAAQNSPYQIYYIKSSDGGANWSTSPILIDQDNTVNNTFPSLSCDSESGTLACVYYSVSNNNYDVYLAISTNSGGDWCNLKINDQTGSGFPGGDYIGISMSKGIVYLVWSCMINNVVYTFTSPVDIINRNFIHTPDLTGNKYIAANSIKTSGDYSSQPPSNLTFEAGYYIDLTDGFQIDEGGKFTAKIMYCPPGGSDASVYANHNPEQNRIISKNDKPKNELIPNEFKLHQNYPNPFNLSTLIRYDLKAALKVRIAIYDILGREVKTLVDEYQNAGYKSVFWEGIDNLGKSVSTGIYFYKIEAGDFVESKKLIILK
jgi:hypothetical protein